MFLFILIHHTFSASILEGNGFHVNQNNRRSDTIYISLCKHTTCATLSWQKKCPATEVIFSTQSHHVPLTSKNHLERNVSSVIILVLQRCGIFWTIRFAPSPLCKGFAKLRRSSPHCRKTAEPLLRGMGMRCLGIIGNLEALDDRYSGLGWVVQRNPSRRA